MEIYPRAPFSLSGAHNSATDGASLRQKLSLSFAEEPLAIRGLSSILRVFDVSLGRAMPPAIHSGRPLYRYCTENELVENIQETGNCADELDDQTKADPNCPYCYGKGTVNSRRFPYEFTLANGNFASLWRSLGLTLREDVWGHVDGRTLLRVLEVPVEKLLSQDSQYEGEQGGTLIDFGISRSQAERYMLLLRSLADEASRREEPVVWG